MPLEESSDRKLKVVAVRPLKANRAARIIEDIGCLNSVARQTGSALETNAKSVKIRIGG